jgi:hypothetical protein
MYILIMPMTFCRVKFDELHMSNGFLDIIAANVCYLPIIIERNKYNELIIVRRT